MVCMWQSRWREYKGVERFASRSFEEVSAILAAATGINPKRGRETLAN